MERERLLLPAKLSDCLILTPHLMFPGCCLQEIHHSVPPLALGSITYGPLLNSRLWSQV